MFDYWGVPEFQAWVNNHQYDGGITENQLELIKAEVKNLRAKIVE